MPPSGRRRGTIQVGVGGHGHLDGVEVRHGAGSS